MIKNPPSQLGRKTSIAALWREASDSEITTWQWFRNSACHCVYILWFMVSEMYDMRCLSLQTNLNVRKFRVKRRTGGKSSEQQSAERLCSYSNRFNVIASLHHMSEWSWVLQHWRWIRIIRPGLLNTAAVLRNWVKYGPLFLNTCTLSAFQRGSQFPTVRRSVVVKVDDLSACVELKTSNHTHFTSPGWVKSVRGSKREQLSTDRSDVCMVAGK